jgi:hypothetical protein
MTWIIDVEFASHDTLKMGAAAGRHSEVHSNPIDGTHRVAVMADNHLDATLVACQMVAATHPDCIPTASMVVL